jgi:aspartyl-tRNA(Asn)/glutamyl-tRNA(Gln) amidotransferase subunit C
MIDREQVSHVAHLAALEFSEAEIVQMALDLSGILDHVERIGELDLSRVEPSPQVVELSNVLRPDVPRPSLERKKALEQAPEPVDAAFRVPSTQAEP